ncbi:hypothetical protein SLEP1_g9573 [Rubroshorea leprosula]|uniref:O-methyltransferase n=1 Tax=Rubroshorea leprosula TaxID=152421 RepID=A0AAV5IGB4_9ROSI|nr:hypothetical protein SLEP1_g9573 [Rubroshorea leprosula]
MTITELITALQINAKKAPYIQRLMCILVHSGFFTRLKLRKNNQEDGYSLTSASRLFLKNEPTSVTPFMNIMLDPMLTKPWYHLASWLQNDDINPFYTQHGTTFWGCASCDPKLNLFFNNGMASDSQLVGKVLVDDKHRKVFEGLSSLVDIGGGTGTLTKAIAEAFPHLDCTVFDLPHVVASLEGMKNLKFVGGDMFEAIPPADTLLLKSILHDWSDEECVKILNHCKEAIKKNGKGGKVIIIDMVKMDEGDQELIETQLFFDMMMMVLLTGKERNEKEWAKLFFEAGFSGYKILPILGVRSLIEVYP